VTGVTQPPERQHQQHDGQYAGHPGYQGCPEHAEYYSPGYAEGSGQALHPGQQGLPGGYDDQGLPGYPGGQGQAGWRGQPAGHDASLDPRGHSGSDGLHGRPGQPIGYDQHGAPGPNGPQGGQGLEAPSGPLDLQGLSGPHGQRVPLDQHGLSGQPGGYGDPGWQGLSGHPMSDGREYGRHAAPAQAWADGAETTLMPPIAEETAILPPVPAEPEPVGRHQQPHSRWEGQAAQPWAQDGQGPAMRGNPPEAQWSPQSAHPWAAAPAAPTGRRRRAPGGQDDWPAARPEQPESAPHPSPGALFRDEPAGGDPNGFLNGPAVQDGYGAAPAQAPTAPGSAYQGAEGIAAPGALGAQSAAGVRAPASGYPGTASPAVQQGFAGLAPQGSATGTATHLSPNGPEVHKPVAPTASTPTPSAASATSSAARRALGGSPIIYPGLEPAALSAGISVLIAFAAMGPRPVLGVVGAALQALTAAGWFRLNGMWPARQGIALAALGGFTASAAALALGGGAAAGALAGTMGGFFALVLVLQLVRPADPAERFSALTVTASATVTAVLAGGWLAAWGLHASGAVVTTGALAAGGATLIAAGARLEGWAAMIAGLVAALLVGGAAGALTGLGAAAGVTLGAAAGGCALLGRRVASYDYPSRFVHFTAGVALPLALAAPAVYAIGLLVG
jgi:hypothetical protein